MLMAVADETEKERYVLGLLPPRRLTSDIIMLKTADVCLSLEN